jgi:hypothetical protein
VDGDRAAEGTAKLLPASDRDEYVASFLMDGLPANCDIGQRKFERFNVPS